MKALLDTSVLVPVFAADHPHHQASFEVFLRLGRREGCCAAHSLAELYSTLTRMPGRHRVSGEHAMLFAGEVRDRLKLITLDENEYYVAIERASSRGVVGGTIYDALVAGCALKARAETIYTWNTRHFHLLNFPGNIRTP